MTVVTEARAKYTADQIKAMGAKGHAFRNPDGHYSYPIGDAEDLDNAIHAVGRGGASHDAIRRYITGRAKALGLSSRIPDNWTSGGSNSASAPRDPSWEQRRRRWAGSLIGERERRSVALVRGNVECRAKPDGSGGTNFEFRGYASTFNEPFQMWDKWGDPYDEDVEPGSFSVTLGRPDLDVPFLIGHNDAGIPMARTRSGTMRLSQDSRGLDTYALLSGRRSDVRDLADAVERGDMDEMSIGFVTRGQHWSDDWMQRHLTELDLHRGDVSVVALAANPATRGATMIAMPGEQASAWHPGEARAASHPPFTGTHSHAHPAYGDEGQHEHEHQHAGDANHHMMIGSRMMTQDEVRAMEDSPTLNQASARRPGEHLARGEVSDSDSHPDFNVPENDPAHNGQPMVKCPYTKRNGCGVMNPGGSRFCNNCGGPIYDGDGLMVLDDSGVVEEVAGAQGDANLLSLRLRLLELA